MATKTLFRPENAYNPHYGFRKPKTPVLNTMAQINRGLVGCWPLGDPSRTTASDISPGHHNGKITGDNPLITLPSLETRIAPPFGGRTWDFNPNEFSGHPQYIDCGSPPDFDIVDQLTITAWAFGTGGSAFPRIVSKLQGTSASGFELLGYDLSGNPAFQVAKGGSRIDLNSGTPAGFFWHFYAGTYNSVTGNCKFYVDGKLAASALGTGNLGTTSLHLTIGTTPDAVDFSRFQGPLDIVRLYKRELSAGEVQHLFLEPYAGIYDISIPQNFVGTPGPPPRAGRRRTYFVLP